MWLYTQYGFFSVVQGLDESKIQIRSRRKEHLVELKKNFSTIQGASINSNSGTDYQHRIVIEKSEWVVLAASLAGDVDYVNFKERVNSIERINGWHEELSENWTLDVYPRCLGDVYISTATTLAEGNDDEEWKQEDRR